MEHSPFKRSHQGSLFGKQLHVADSDLRNEVPVPNECSFWTKCAQLSSLTGFIHLAALWLPRANIPGTSKTFVRASPAIGHWKMRVPNRGVHRVSWQTCGRESLWRKSEAEEPGVSVFCCCPEQTPQRNGLSKQPLMFVHQELNQRSAGQFLCSTWHHLGHAVIF